MKISSWKALVLAVAIAAVPAAMSAPLHAQETTAPSAMQPTSDADLAVQQQIQSKLNRNLNFAETQLVAMVDGDVVVLRGNARDVVDHLRALDIARKYAGGRRIVDYTTIKQIYRRTW